MLYIHLLTATRFVHVLHHHQVSSQLHNTLLLI